MYLLSLGETLLSFCLGRSAANDEAPGLSGDKPLAFDEELELVPKTDFTLDACGHWPTSNFSAAFLFEVLSWVTERVSDKATDVVGTCSDRLPSAGRDVCNGEPILSVGVNGMAVRQSNVCAQFEGLHEPIFGPNFAVFDRLWTCIHRFALKRICCLWARHSSHSAWISLLLAMRHEGCLEAWQLASKDGVLLSTLAAIAQTRISLLLSCSRYVR